MAKRDLTVGEYLSDMAKAVVHANLAAMETARDILATGKLRVEVPIGDATAVVKGPSLTPDGYVDLDEFEIECESSVHVAYDEHGEPTGLSMSMKRGLFKRDTHVKFRAKFHRHGTIEAVEILRDAADAALRREMERLEIKEGE